jgi:hypothetical protein
MENLKQGSIVYVKVLDLQGKNPKRRPVVVLSPPDQVKPGEPFIGVAVSTRPQDPLPPECVRLPSNRQKHGSSGLSERCVAVCNWPVQFYAEDIEEARGMIYGELLYEIIEKVKAHLQKAPKTHQDGIRPTSP